MDWFKNLFNKKREEFKIPKRFQYLENRNPDRPINFGYKTNWAAVKSDDHRAIADFLDFDKSKECDWVEGTIRAYNGDTFILPSINSWVLLHGIEPYPYKIDNLNYSDTFLNRLSNHFGEAQMFGSHRVVSAAYWMLSIGGEIKRLYFVADGEGGEIGEPTKIEQQWNLIDWNSPQINTDEYHENTLYPDEEEVLIVAENWSINPMKIEEIENIESKGIHGRIKY